MGVVAGKLTLCPNCIVFYWPQRFAAVALSLFTPVARVESAAVDEEYMTHEAEMRVLPPHFTTKALVLQSRALFTLLIGTWFVYTADRYVVCLHS